MLAKISGSHVGRSVLSLGFKQRGELAGGHEKRAATRTNAHPKSVSALLVGPDGLEGKPGVSLLGRELGGTGAQRPEGRNRGVAADPGQYQVRNDFRHACGLVASG